MIRYSPPKSQIWGHQVGRLSAVSVVERCLQFLNDQCAILASPPSELTLSWNPAQHALISGVAAEIDEILGQPTTGSAMPSADGPAFHQCRWPFSADKLSTVAAWFDRLAEPMKTRDVVAQCSTFWAFAWRDEPQPLAPLRSPGGMFGVHLGRPHRITTLLSFRDLDRYASIKDYIAKLGLAELSDKHLRPKIGADAGKRGAK